MEDDLQKSPENMDKPVPRTDCRPPGSLIVHHIFSGIPEFRFSCHYFSSDFKCRHIQTTSITTTSTILIMPLAKIGHIEISYEICGSGEPLLLIGGFGMTMEFWGTLLESLAHNFRVIAYDNRGAGRSTVPAEPFTIAEMAEDAIGLIDALNLETVHVFGVSMGGMIAQLLCANYPDRIRRVMLGCTSHGGPHAVSPESRVMELFGQAANPDLSPEEAARMIVPCLFSESFIRDEPDRIEAFVRLSVAHSMTPAGAKGQMGALALFDAEELLRKIESTVLVVTGSDDLLIPPENSQLLTGKIPHASLEVIGDAGHNFFFEKPETVNGIAIRYLLARP